MEVYWEGLGLSSPFSGIYSHAASLAHSLKKRSLDPVCLGGGIDVKRASEVFGSSAFPLAYPMPSWRAKIFGPTRSYRQVCCAKQSSPVILHCFANTNASIRASLDRDIRVVLTVHDLIPLMPHAVSFGTRLFFEILLGRALSVADRIICISKWTRDTLVARYPQVSSKVDIVNNGLPSEVPYIVRKPDTPVNVLFVSRWERYKRFDLLHKILASTRKKRFVFSIITDARGREAIEAHLGAESSHAKIYTEVSEAKKAELFKKSDVLLTTSEYEGCGLSVLDAIAYGMPVVFAPCAGIGEQIRSTRVGIEVSAQANQAEWYDALEEAALRKEDPLFETDIVQCRRLHNSWDDSASQVYEIYRKAMESS